MNQHSKSQHTAITAWESLHSHIITRNGQEGGFVSRRGGLTTPVPTARDLPEKTNCFFPALGTAAGRQNIRGTDSINIFQSLV